MKRVKKSQIVKGVLLTLAFCMSVFVWSSDCVTSFAAGTANVIANSAKVRKSADVTSDAIASVKKGDKLDVIASATDSNGYTWYKIYVDDEETGYIRSDLVTVEGTISAEKTETANKDTATQEQTAEPEATTVNETDVATAKTTADVRVRKGAGTNFDVAGQAKKATEVTVSGIAADLEGKNWYQVSFNEENKTVNGFIREDFLEVVSRVEPPAEEPEEESPVEEEPEVENQDYYLKYMENDAGEMDWYLINNLEGTGQSLTQILNVLEQVKNEGLKESEQISTMRMILIALAVVVVILIVVVVILIFKLRDSYEYEYEDEDEDEAEDDEETEDALEEEDEDNEAAGENKAHGKPLFAGIKKKAKTEETEDEALEEVQPEKSSKPKKSTNKAWQSKDFLELDDDMEFEFLDL